MSISDAWRCTALGDDSCLVPGSAAGPPTHRPHLNEDAEWLRGGRVAGVQRVAEKVDSRD